MKLKNKKIVEKIIDLLLNILIFIFGIILLISIYSGVQTKILGNEYSNFFGYSVFEVQTGSMENTINPGDWIIVRLTQDVKLNDVITYKLGNEYVTHRVIEVYNNKYITKGDANNAKDNPISQKQIVGKVVSILANFGILRKTLFNPAVLITLIIALFILNFAFKKDKKLKNDKSVKGEHSFYDVIAAKINLLCDKAMPKIKELWGKAVKNISSIYAALVKKMSALLENIKGDKTVKDKKIVTAETADSKIALDKKPVIVEPVPSSNTMSSVLADVDKGKDEVYKDENDLDKTSFFRIISVDSNEVDDKYKDLVEQIKNSSKNENEDVYRDENDLDKTSLFRIISVDADEVNGTLLDIAKNELKVPKKEEKSEEAVKPSKEEEEPQTNDTLTDINLNLLKGKKGKNIIDTVMLIKKEELGELINILLEEHKPYPREATIRETFINAYIDGRYYNHLKNYHDSRSIKNFVARIEHNIKNATNELLDGYHGKDDKYSVSVKIYATALSLIANLDKAKYSIEDAKAKNEFYKKEIMKYSTGLTEQKIEDIIFEVIEAQKIYTSMLEYFFKKLETNMFTLDFNRLSTKKDMYCLRLEHNVTFSKVYSDYIIDKTYSEGIVAEDKMSVLLTLLSVHLVENMMSSSFDKKYIFHIPGSLYAKEKKLEKILEMIDDEYAKDCVIILITIEDLLSNKQIVKRVRRMGYKFAIFFDKEVIIKEKDWGIVYVADYIFVDKKSVNMTNIRHYIPEELTKNIIYEDITDKVGNLGGE